MGAGASTGKDAVAEKLMSELPDAPGDLHHAWAKLDVDKNGHLDKDEFGEASKALGFNLSPEELEKEFSEFDRDGNDKISHEEFVSYIQAQADKIGQGREQSLTELGIEDLTSLASLMGPHEAAQGFKRARALVKAKPEVAMSPMPGSGWLAVHTLLMMDTPKGTTYAAAAAAKPLIIELLKAAKSCAQVRILEGGTCYAGHLPLHLAVQRGWDKDVVHAAVKAWEAGAKTVDVSKAPKKVPKVANLKTGRWARKIGEQSGASPDVMELLPHPHKAKKKELGKPEVEDGLLWTPGSDEKLVAKAVADFEAWTKNGGKPPTKKKK